MLVSKFPTGINLKTDQISLLSVAAVANTPGSLTVTWTNPTSAKFKGVLIRYKTGSYPTSETDGTLVYSGAGTSFTLTGLTGGTQYYFRAFAFASNSSGTKTVYNTTTTGAQATGTTYASPVTGLTVTAIENTPGSLTVSWTAPAGNYSHVEVRFKAGSYPTSVTDGSSAYNGTKTQNTVTGLTGGTTYYFRAFVYNGSVYNSNTSQEATGKTYTSSVTNLAVNMVSNTPGSLSVTWTAPAGTYSSVMVRYKAGSYPTSITDGAQAYSGTGTSATVTGLTGSTTYYFRAFTYNGSVYNSDAAQEASNMTAATAVTLSVTARTAATLTVSFSSCSDASRGVYLVIKAGSYPTSVTDGTQFYVAWNTAGGTATASGLSGGTTYYIRGFVHNGNGVFNDATSQEISATTSVAAGSLIFTSSQTYTIPAGVTAIDIFCVGGGGGGSAPGYGGSSSAYYGGCGGGGGYTATLLNVSVTPGTTHAVVVGAGGTNAITGTINGSTDAEHIGGNGGTSSFGSLLSAAGGVGGYLTQGYSYTSPTDGLAGGNGGSAGGSGYAGSTSGYYGGQGGTDGDSGYHYSTTSSTAITRKAYNNRVYSQETTTRAFGESSNTLYSGGGGGGGKCTSSYDYNGLGGAGGGGRAGTAGAIGPSSGVPGTANTGGGGGGTGSYNYSSSSCASGQGGSGIVIIRWAEQG